jgi:tRNA pseudouridine55 synthase
MPGRSIRLASGCLPIALGEATKTVPFVMDGRKVYEFTVRWGEETATDDREGEVVGHSDVRPDEEAIRAVLPEFTGAISQVPPRYSAVKIAGERAYDIARGGEVIVLEPREILVHRLSVAESPDPDSTTFIAECGKGTYVRALARDMGRRLGTYGHVSALRRLVVGPFGEEHMISLEKLDELRHNAALPTGSARRRFCIRSRRRWTVSRLSS